MIRFLDVEIDVPAETVRRGGEEQRLRQKTFQVLTHLFMNRDRVVSRDELFHAVWNDAAVTEDTLVQCVVEIRRALGDDPRSPRFVRTVPKRGYHFIAPLAEDAVRPERRRYWPAVAAVAAGMAIVAAVLAIERSDGSERAAGPAEPTLASVGMTSSPEAYRLYTLGVDRANDLHGPEAVALLERAIRIDPQFAMAYARIGYAYGVRGPEAARARPYIERALKMPLSDKDRLIVEGWRLIIANDFERAIGQFQIIVEKYPTDVESQLRLGHLLAGEERSADAVAVFEKARLIEPGRPEIYNALGLYSTIGEHEKSIEARRHYVELRPNEPNALDSLGLSYHAAGRYDEALSQYSRALALDPGFAIVRYHRAATYVELGRFREAAADVREVLAHASEPVERDRAYCTLADIYHLNGDGQREREVIRQMRPDTSWIPLGATSAIRDEARLAQSQFNGRGRRGTPRREFYLRAYAALSRGDREEALRQFRDGERFQPLIWYVDRFQTGVADAYLVSGRFREAAAEYTRVLDLSPNHARAILGRAQANERLQLTVAARRDYAGFLDVWRNADADARDLHRARAGLERLNR